MTEQSPLERAARALAKRIADSSHDAGSVAWCAAYDAVCSAIAKISHPSDAVLKVMRDTVPVDGHEWDYLDDEAQAHWQAMIDAALNEA